jgi:hypothetical protein
MSNAAAGAVDSPSLAYSSKGLQKNYLANTRMREQRNTHNADRRQRHEPLGRRGLAQCRPAKLTSMLNDITIL